MQLILIFFGIYLERYTMSIYENIKEIASEHGLSIKEVATKAGIGENSIYRWRLNRPSTSSL